VGQCSFKQKAKGVGRLPFVSKEGMLNRRAEEHSYTDLLSHLQAEQQAFLSGIVTHQSITLILDKMAEYDVETSRLSCILKKFKVTPLADELMATVF